MHSCCRMIGQCLTNNEKTIDSKDSHSRGREYSLFCYSHTGWPRKMAAYFCRALEGGIVGKGLKDCVRFTIDFSVI